MNVNFFEVIKRVSRANMICMGLILTLVFPFTVDASVSSKHEYKGEKTSSQSVHKKTATRRLQKLYAHLPQPNDLGSVFDEAAKRHGIDQKLLVSVCVTESHFRRGVVNNGAIGMCQVVPRYHGTTRKQMMNYRKNVDKAAEIIADLKAGCRNNVRCIVHSYNVGKTAYKKGVRSPQYYAKVMKQYRRTT